MTPEPHDEKACRRVREQFVSTAENLSVTNVGIAAAIRELERLRKEIENPNAAKAFGVAVNIIQEKIQNPSAHVPLDIPDFQEPEVRAALETIASMRTEYTIEYQSPSDSQWHRVSDWSEEYPLIDGEELAPRERIVMRYVTAPQPLGEEQ